MRKTIITTFVVVLIVSLASLSFAATYNKAAGVAYKTIEGQVVSVNTDKNIFVIKDKDDGREYVVNASTTDTASLTHGANVRVNLNQGSNLASSIIK